MIASKRLINLNAGKAFLLMVIIFISSCSGITETGPSRLVISLVDSPADYQAVNVDIQEISLKMQGEEDWISLDGFTPGIYNLLEFTGGNELKLADMEFPAGNISQIRLKLGQDNTLVSKDYDSKLVVPSGSSSGLKFNVDLNIHPGKTNYVKIDFDAARSIVRLGNTGQFLLKPVIKIFALENTGSITGRILPADENVLINIIIGNEIIASSYAPENHSKFMVPGIQEGVYKVSIEVSEGGYQKILNNVAVTNGQVKDLGTIDMSE